MANYVSTIANRGYFYVPHTVKKIEGCDTINRRFTEKHYTSIDTSIFNIVVQGMEKSVNEGGTSNGANLKSRGIIVCGKTGTAQNPHGQEDHSIFISFAPKDNPKIAIAVYVENGGFGATYAVPIATLLEEKYLTDSISRPWLEQYLLKARINYNYPIKTTANE